MMSADFDAELLRRLENAVGAMPRKQREIFLVHRLDDLSYAEIASRTGLSVRQVERHMAKALYKLCKQIDGHPLSWWERWF
jgi:RNA polymerase sigma-70 factor (ECF subfamily)